MLLCLSVVLLLPCLSASLERLFMNINMIYRYIYMLLYTNEVMYIMNEVMYIMYIPYLWILHSN